MDDRTVDCIFAGNLDSLPPVSSKIVRIFTSSTFTDTALERNLLMEKVYPRLKDYCRERHGLEFQVVDMRWGVRDEATDDHMTTELCMKEIENCQRLSMGPNFVVFLAQKYGYRPIPTIIVAEELNVMKEALVAMGCDISLLDRWYQQDSNAVPPVCILQPISSILVNFNNKRVPKLQAQDQATWWDTMGKLQKMLRKAAQALHASESMDGDAMHNYMMSVTEREVINGILNVKNTRNHCLAYIRQINNINMANLKKVTNYVDIINRNVDTEAQKLLSNLRDERLPAKIEASNIVRFTVEWTGRDGLDLESHKDYLRQFTAHFYKHIIKLVDRAMRKEDLSSQGQIITEILQHLHSCNNGVKIFQGRQSELDYIKEYMQGPSEQPLILHGEGGSGKTSLLAKSAAMVPEWCSKNSKPILVLRFLGTTPDSSTVVPMLTSICHQISYNYIIPWADVPDDLIPLIAYLKRLLAVATSEQPLFIFLDSVDQLAGCNESNMLSWLPSRLPQNVKLIASTVSGDESKEFRVLQKILENEKQFVDVKPLGIDLANDVIKYWLETAHRDLNAYQWKLVRNVLSRCTLPIFVKLVFAEICRWKSYSRPADTTLANTVMDSIMKLFDRIELQHGKTLVFHALAYITASKSGLSETELEDLISLDDKVLDDVYQYHLPPVRRIPPLLWTRIRNDLPNYLSERDADGVSVMNWYHRQFREAAIERYFKNLNTVCYFHSSTADYFLGIWGGGTPKPFKYTEIQKHRFGLTDKEGSADRKVPCQPLVFFGADGRVARYNLRKFGELPFHLIRSKRFEDLFENVIFNYQWLHSKLSSCPLQAVLSDFEDSKEHLSDKDDIREVMLVADALRLGGAILSQYPNMLAPQMIGRLLPLKTTHKRVRSLLQQCDDLGFQQCGLIPAYHSLHTPGGPLKYSLEGHQFAVFGFILTSDSRYVLSVSNKFIMWDLSTGEVTRDVNPNIRGIMQTLAISPDDKHAVTYTNYNEVLLLSLLSGDVHSYKIQEEETENSIKGVAINDCVFTVWIMKEWFVYCLATGKVLEHHIIEENKFSILDILFIGPSEYYQMLRKGDSEDSGQILRSFINDANFKDISLAGGLAITEIRTCIYVSEPDGLKSSLARYKLSDNSWKLEKTISTQLEKVLSLVLTSCENFLIGTFTLKFIVWNLVEGSQADMLLPHGVRNISTKPLHSQSSLVLTKFNKYAIGGVRKNLYVWDVGTGKMLKVLDAHFGRILQLRPLIVDEFNAVISSSIDKSVKVWNINNIFEQVHAIDRMEMPIESISIARDSDVAVTVTRGCLGVWSLTTGKLWAKLADSPVGAIVTHALITGDARYIVCTESGNLLVWTLDKGTVLSREPAKGVHQLLLTEDDRLLFVIAEEEGGGKAVCTCKSVPDLTEMYTIDYPVLSVKPAAVTPDGQFLVLVSVDKNRECLLVYQTVGGSFVHKVYLRMTLTSSYSNVIPFPAKGYLVGLTGGDKSFIIDVKNRKLLRTVKKWNGYCTSDGKLGLFAPNRGGLEMIELRHGSTAKVLQTRMSEGVFSVIAKFTSTNKYVMYYHSGRRTVQVFRVDDGKMIANYRLSAEACALTSTPNGHCVVVGGVDGSLTVLVIVDPNDPQSKERLSALPSRSERSGRTGPAVSFKMAAKLVATACSRMSAQGDSEATSKACVIS